MSQADELLATLSVDYTDEARIYVNDDRTITVLDELKRIAVQGDHNIETVTFDCPRYWDGHDFSQMKVYVTYMRADGFKDSYLTKNLRVSDEDDTRILFDWTISGNVTKVSGNLSFLVYIESTSADPCWHSRLNQQMVVDEGLSATEQILRAPDSIEAVLAQVTANYIAAAKNEIEGKTAQSLASIPEDYTAINNMAEEALREKSNTVKMEAEGETIIVNDSADNALLGLKIYGKSTQVTTTGKQLFDKSTAVTGMLEGDGSIVVDGAYVTSNYIPITPNTAYYQTDKESIRSKYYDSNKNPLSNVWDMQQTSAGTFTTPKNAHYFRVTVRYSYIDSYMLNLGSEAAPYEPYSGGVASPSPEWPQELTSVENPNAILYGGQLLKVVSATTANVRLDVDGSVCKITNLTANRYGNATYFLDLPPGVYTIAVDSFSDSVIDTGHMVKVSNDTNGANLYITALSVGNLHRSFTLDSITRVKVELYSGTTAVGDVCVIEGLRIIAGDAPMTWSPYVEPQTVFITRSLPGIPVSSGGNYTDPDGQQWVCDEIDFERGVYVQRVLEYAPTSIVAVASGSKNNRASVTLPHPGLSFSYTDANGYCSHFKYNASVYSDTGNELGFIVSSQTLFFRFTSSSGITTTELGQQWIDQQADSGTPFTVTYILATPIETPLSSAELASFKMVRSNYPTTTVLNDSGAHMAIKYAADTKTYVDNSLSNGTLVDTATGKLYRLTVTNGQLTVIAV